MFFLESCYLTWNIAIFLFGGPLLTGGAGYTTHTQRSQHKTLYKTLQMRIALVLLFYVEFHYLPTWARQTLTCTSC